MDHEIDANTTTGNDDSGEDVDNRHGVEKGSSDTRPPAPPSWSWAHCRGSVVYPETFSEFSDSMESDFSLLELGSCHKRYDSYKGSYAGSVIGGYVEHVHRGKVCELML